MTEVGKPGQPAPSQPSDRKGKSCPVCGRPTAVPFAPFCSRRCADVDLHRWLGGVYRIPAEPEDEAPEEPG